MSGRDRGVALAGGIAAGALGGLFGVGGGVIIVPVLTGLLRTTQHQAHGTSLAAIGATALSSLVFYGVGGRVDWPVAALAGLASMGAARLGARAASRISPRQLKLAFSIFLGLVGLKLLWQGTPGPGTTHLTLGYQLLIAAGVGIAAGLLSGFMGVGGGVVAVPAFTLLLGMTQHMAQGTSLAMILLTAPAGAWEHSRRGNVLGRTALWLAAGAALGGLLASALAQKIPGPALARAFAVFLLFQSARGILQARRAGPARAPSRSPSGNS